MALLTSLHTSTLEQQEDLSPSRQAAKENQMATPPEDEVARQIVDAAYQVHTTLGPGLLESVYEVVLAHELGQRALAVARQVPVGVTYKNIRFDLGFRADMVVENIVLVELKSVETLLPVHKKQVLTYIKVADLRLGLLVNFGAARIKDGITRIANNLPE